MPLPFRVLLAAVLLEPSVAQPTPAPPRINRHCKSRWSVRRRRSGTVSAHSDGRALSNRGRRSLVVARPIPNCELGQRPIAFCWNVVKDGKPLSPKPRKPKQQPPSIDVEDFLILQPGRSIDVTPLAVDELFPINEHGKYDVQMTYCFDRRLSTTVGPDSIAKRIRTPCTNAEPRIQIVSGLDRILRSGSSSRRPFEDHSLDFRAGANRRRLEKHVG